MKEVHKAANEFWVGAWTVMRNPRGWSTVCVACGHVGGVAHRDRSGAEYGARIRNEGRQGCETCGECAQDR